MTLSLFSQGKLARIVHGKCEDILPRLAAESVDAVVTDPPSAVGFMSLEWDSNKGGRDRWVGWMTAVMAQCRRVLKPGGHALVWTLPRTSHWTAWSIEDGGFEIRDSIAHLFGQAMPKSRNMGTVLEGADRERWDGWGTGLKPAREDWVLARKPFDGTVESNVLAYGTGALNINGCRIGESGGTKSAGQPNHKNNVYGRGMGGMEIVDGGFGRWPANTTLDDEAARQLDEQTGDRRPGATPAHRRGIGYAEREGYENAGTEGERIELGGGGASRFYYCVKADDDDKTANGAIENDHETVKSVALMRWLVRLVTPPGGVVLDAFAGSGTTGVACAEEGFSFIGIEQHEKHHATARARLALSYSTVEVSIP